ncbi:hypothetical protein J6590_044061 [Homalodisca vitripennis]|nr:hypothetical protein J6590_044061 [Homalodisca vitripennis]
MTAGYRADGAMLAGVARVAVATTPARANGGPSRSPSRQRGSEDWFFPPTPRRACLEGSILGVTSLVTFRLLVPDTLTKYQIVSNLPGLVARCFAISSVAVSCKTINTVLSLLVSPLEYLMCISTGPASSSTTEDAKLDFKVSSCAGGGPGEPATSHSVSVTTSSGGGSEQQFNIFPAIFSRQLNFHHQGPHGGKLMDELRPNLGLLGLVDDHSHFHHHHHDKKPAKTETPDFAALYALPGGLESQQHTPPSRQLADHSGKS